MVTVRLFAAAAEAAGVDEASMTHEPSVAALREALAARFGADFSRVLKQCSIVVNRTRASDDVPVPAGALVDVLPPFAGG
ncbi:MULTISPECIES: MoaD/ThiS family protein [Demequina]|uniref:Molybdopterin synthase sulfur carrier subunit n=1 Tax=Demequina litorisediminis TaxID=1849022 RepID=A0ABQ6I917_9MICO|nr:MoaD/ThiS family protein [Demequina litorisediminis]GMA34270.1 molybdopterin synthase sulfur carrier subunit [Demequina litorisediminis]